MLELRPQRREGAGQGGTGVQGRVNERGTPGVGGPALSTMIRGGEIKYPLHTQPKINITSSHNSIVKKEQKKDDKQQ